VGGLCGVVARLLCAGHRCRVRTGGVRRGGAYLGHGGAVGVVPPRARGERGGRPRRAVQHDCAVRVRSRAGERGPERVAGHARVRVRRGCCRDVRGVLLASKAPRGV